VTSEDARTIALVLIVAIAPVALVLIFAILRGYRVEFRMSRHQNRTKDEDET